MKAYIVKGFRTAVGKAPRGIFRFTRPDDLAAATVKHLVKSLPELDVNRIDDVIVGNAMPEGSQGLNMARLISLMGLKTVDVPGVTVNRFCSSGIETIGIATAKIQSGMADCIIAGGVECMSPIPFGGWRIIPNYDVAKDNSDWYWNMGLTAEAVADKWNISRKDQDEFALNSQLKAAKAQDAGRFDLETVAVEIPQRKKEPIDYRRGGVITLFVGIGLYLLGVTALGALFKGVGLLVGVIGLGTLIAGYLYPNTGHEITNAVERFEGD